MINPWQRFLTFVALFVGSIFLLIQQGTVAWFLKHFSSVTTLSVSAAMIAIFAAVFLFVGGYAGRKLQIECQVLTDIASKFAAPNVDPKELVRRLLGEDYNGPSAMREVLRVLARLHAHRSKRPVDKAMFVELHEQKVAAPLALMEHYRQLLFYLGLFGTVGGVIYALATTKSPQTAEEVRMFSYATLEGLGISYTSTFFGMGGAIVLFRLNGGYERCAGRISELFQVLLEETLLVLEREDFQATPAKEISS